MNTWKSMKEKEHKAVAELSNRVVLCLLRTHHSVKIAEFTGPEEISNSLRQQSVSGRQLLGIKQQSSKLVCLEAPS